MRYANINTADNTIREFRDFDERPEDIPHKNIVWLPAPRVPAPSYDAARQVLDGPFYEVGVSEVIESWRIRDKTAKELSDDIDAKIARVDEATRKAIEALAATARALAGYRSYALQLCPW